ncbi:MULTISPECIES: 50S ribosomal protein L11 methyltransferase [Chromobacterium]|uniref:Ribosomal protein L11 methyltransferase n=2 Tax=Chromobacterium TaxID=535 RepID=A0A1W0CA50_9NEIS|nr:MULTISPECIES: 50S ribosomal protein L11 methyltransferase [Chromobacterium]AXT45265.1 50S ribosomal protein L11 methyltransferase [Chromobacterium rhizoryzae]MBK0415998.1 50S ribosomal protein L11 methyltransferase [Chromobacterium haemolyticum]MBO0416869.1 50S ribosomal protein L11 methyltransferase [Chromobacterium haemolyticum]MBO0500385.1 50S ribosomal protein L11 methyltransferase [Chromobacterium haemolyticum]OQS31622.1 ribosomal protein L11 methyltransferase [Chromobacterium haemolyt
MAWLQATIDAESTVAERLADALMDAGALSTAIEDAFAGTEREEPIFGEPGEPVDKLWSRSRIITLFDEAADVALLIAAAANACGLSLPSYNVERVEEQDWVRLTQSQFDPIRISDRLWITPTWHEPPAPNAVNLQLDPGLAFGTGSHPTTRLCLQWLDAHLQGGESVLDYGCGSGILAIAALKLGAVSALGVDIDPQAVRASQDNAEQNQVKADFRLPDQNPEAVYDVVLANILANPLRMLGQLLASHVKTGGRIVLSGILAEQAEELSAIYEQWFQMDAPVFDEGWTRLTGTRRPTV